MFLAANFVEALAVVLGYILVFYKWAFIISAVISWVSPDPFNPIVQFLERVTDPILDPIRRMMGGYFTGIDLSPMIALVLILFMDTFLVQSLFELAAQIR
ncbi:MAG: YggT family protein [Nitrospirota bacterium]